MRRGPDDAELRDDDALAPAQIVLCPGGPMLVRGDVVIEDAAGQRHRTTRPVSAVCRCLRSQQLPWCDSTHRLLPPEQRPEGSSRTGKAALDRG